MKALVLSLLALFASVSAFCKEPITKDGYCKGKKLRGRVRVVTANADFKVFVKTAFADLHVKKIGHGVGSVGEWFFVDGSMSDFTIQFVKAECFADFSIRYVEAFPGVQHPSTK